MIEPIVDISKWQQDIDEQKMLGAGTLSMYIKAGGTDKYNGANYTDYRFRENAEKFSEKVPCGYYFFFYPHIDGTKQANFFCKLLNSVKWNLPPAVDVELNPRNVSQYTFQRELKEFLDTVENQLNVKCTIYTRGWFWNRNVGTPGWAIDHKLWVARYGETLQHPWDNNPNSPLRPRPWTDFWMWQYSADKNKRGKEFGVATSGIDINRVNMTKEEFYEFANWNIEEPPPVEEEPEVPEPEPEEEPEEPTQPTPQQGFLRQGYSALRLRARPTTQENNTVGTIQRGYTFTIHKELQVGDDIWWLIELPNHTVGWGARRYQSVNYLESI